MSPFSPTFIEDSASSLDYTQDLSFDASYDPIMDQMVPMVNTLSRDALVLPVVILVVVVVFNCSKVQSEGQD